MNSIQVRFLHPFTGEALTVSLPRDTRFSGLTALLYEKGFLEPQKPGYRYLYQEHLCGTGRVLGDYVPESAGEMTLEIFAFPEVLV
ncbi:MAG: hypothetical protein HFG01_08605 [Oscillibacter sp.]|jgi:hypothetical protein|nr:hypothetical protein [Oscillibacter sp.]